MPKGLQIKTFPPSKTDSNVVAPGYRMPKSKLSELKQIAADNDIEYSDLMRHIVAEFLESNAG